MSRGRLMLGVITFGALLFVSSLQLYAAGSTPGESKGAAAAGAKKAKPEFPPLDSVLKGLTKVISTADGAPPLYDLYQDKKKGRLLAVLSRDYRKQLLMIACTISGGDPEAGVMGPTHYAKWRRINKQLALVAPNVNVRTSGDKQAQDSVEDLFTGRVIASTPILSMAPEGRPVVDLGSLCTKQATRFFGPSVFGGYGASLQAVNPGLVTLTKAKSFPENFIFEYEAPRMNGRLVRFTYSFGKLEGTPGFKPRKADPRVGYFYNWHEDFARIASEEVIDRYITRWNVEKADPKLKLSPPKKPITWYIEHTTPIRFRRYVREGILLWNQAFQEVGILDAVVVNQQDAGTGAHMEKDPEDARYNFFRWNASDQGYAIGPSRAHPHTGEILDADVVWHQGLTRAVRSMLSSLSGEEAVSTLSPETLAWLNDHPTWDPRVRMASPARQQQIRLQREMASQLAVTEPLTSDKHPWTHGINDPTNTACRMGSMMALDFALVDSLVAAGFLGAEKGEEDLLDGLPEEYIGSMIRYISAHEVGHCIGLQHNMAASSIHTLEEINSKDFSGAMIGSVMDYAAVNINHELGEVQGPYATGEIGPYDKWAIAYGYGPGDKLEDVLKEVSKPEHIYVSQLAIAVGSDPRNNTWDMGANSLNFVDSRMGLVRKLRGKLVEELVEKGTSWKRARDRMGALLGTQFQGIILAASWVGGSYLNNDFKGDPGERAPIEDVAAADQRRALQLIIKNSFYDEAFGMTPDLLRHLGREYWFDPSAINDIMDDPSFNVHDVVGGVQATALTFLMNPTTLRRVYDNEYRMNGAEDVLTLAELMTTVIDAAWSECSKPSKQNFTTRKPMVTSFRRNLQRETIDRLIDLALLDSATSPALRTISALAAQELRRINGFAEGASKASPDSYTDAHLADVRTRIRKALDAVYVQNQ